MNYFSPNTTEFKIKNKYFIQERVEAYLNNKHNALMYINTRTWTMLQIMEIKPTG